MATTEMITCINCPVGCRMEVTHEGEQVLSVKGNTCKRGDSYARQECVAPLRMVTAVAPVREREMPVSLKTRTPIPKKLIDDCMRAVMDHPFEAPIAAGDVLIENVCGSGVDVIATKAVP
ncbi:MAG: DUF1667 domain-containing protein [Clostridia bacterium]|nr:DUF1667 domain-containing protein [Clostridia bacterium]